MILDIENVWKLPKLTIVHFLCTIMTQILSKIIFDICYYFVDKETKLPKKWQMSRKVWRGVNGLLQEKLKIRCTKEEEEEECWWGSYMISENLLLSKIFSKVSSLSAIVSVKFKRLSISNIATGETSQNITSCTILSSLAIIRGGIFSRSLIFQAFSDVMVITDEASTLQRG